MANRNFRNEQTQENVPDVIMAKFIESVCTYFPDLDVTVGQEENTDPRASGFVRTFTNPRTAAMFAAYQIGRRAAEYVPGAFVLARLENNQLVFDDRQVYLEHQDAARAQRNKSRSTRRPHLLFSTTQRTMEYATNVSGCKLEDFAVAAPMSGLVETKDDRFTSSQLKFLERHFGSMMDSKIQESVDGLMDNLIAAIDGLKEELCGVSVTDDDVGCEGDAEEKTNLELQDKLQFDSAGLTD